MRRLLTQILVSTAGMGLCLLASGCNDGGGTPVAQNDTSASGAPTAPSAPTAPTAPTGGSSRNDRGGAPATPPAGAGGPGAMGAPGGDDEDGDEYDQGDGDYDKQPIGGGGGAGMGAPGGDDEDDGEYDKRPIGGGGGGGAGGQGLGAPGGDDDDDSYDKRPIGGGGGAGAGGQGLGAPGGDDDGDDGGKKGPIGGGGNAGAGAGGSGLGAPGGGDEYDGFDPTAGDLEDDGGDVGDENPYEGGFDPTAGDLEDDGGDVGDENPYEGFDPTAGDLEDDGGDVGDENPYGGGFDPTAGDLEDDGGDVGDENPYGGFDPTAGDLEDDGGAGDFAGDDPGLGAPGGARDRGNARGGQPRGPARSGSAAREPKSKGLMGKAEAAMAAGKEDDAFRFLHALALTDENSNLLQQYGWIPGLKHAGMAVRFGVGARLTVTPANYNGNLYPIGVEQNLPQRSRTGSRGRGGYDEDFGDPAGGGFDPGGRSAGGASGSSGPLNQYTGELGDQFIDGLADRLNNGYFGNSLKQLSGFVSVSPAPRRGGNFGGGDDAPPGYGDDEFGDEFGDDDTGLPGLGVPGQGGGGGNDDDAGGVPGGKRSGGIGGGRGGPPRGGAGGGPARTADAGPATMMAGVTYLGLGNQRELMQKAKDQGIDVLVMFDIKVKRDLRSGVVTNEVSMHAHNVASASGDLLFRGKTMNNIKVQAERAKPNAKDLLEDWADRVFSAIDNETTGLRMRRLPEVLNTTNVKAYVDRLVSQSYANPLPVLAEVAFYHSKNLLSDTDRTFAFQKLIGELEGEQLAIGNPAERVAIVQKWLPK